METHAADTVAPGTTTCPHAHGRWAALINSAPDAQLAVLVGPPAPEAAATVHGARVEISRSYGGDCDACRREERCSE
jgi:hypothetical protein